MGVEVSSVPGPTTAPPRAAKPARRPSARRRRFAFGDGTDTAWTLHPVHRYAQAAMADERVIEDEFRVEVELADEGHGLSLGERLRALDLDDEARERLGSRVIVTRDGSHLFLYANTRESCAEA